MKKIRIISSMILFCFTCLALKINFLNIIDLPSIILVLVTTFALNRFRVKEKMSNLEKVNLMQKNAWISGIVFSFLSMIIFLSSKKIENINEAYIILNLLPLFYASILWIYFDIKKDNVKKCIFEKLQSSVSNYQIQVLNAREFEIVAYIKQGKTDKEIAKQLFITENTLKKNLNNIFLKLDIENRIELENKLNDNN